MFSAKSKKWCHAGGMFLRVCECVCVCLWAQDAEAYISNGTDTFVYQVWRYCPNSFHKILLVLWCWSQFSIMAFPAFGPYMSAYAVQYKFIWPQQAPVNQPEAGIKVMFTCRNPHSCFTAAILMQTPSVIMQHSDQSPRFHFRLIKKEDEWFHRIIIWKPFLACVVINRQFVSLI